jgi:hypothetical protein
MGYVTGYLTCCETLGTFYLACYMPLDTHNMRGKKTKQKMIVGFLKNVLFTSILRLVKGSPTTLYKIRLLLRGAKRGKKRGKGQTGGGKLQR